MKGRPLLTALAAAAALAASALAFVWLQVSAQHADRPPMFAIAAFVFAVGAAVEGVRLALRAVRGMRGTRVNHD
jgi:hypothetical protein